jgi:ubiquinone biosynthesis protein
VAPGATHRATFRGRCKTPAFNGRSGARPCSCKACLVTRPDVVGPALARDLRSLQDSMPPFSQAEAEKAVAAALNKKLSDVFVTFGPPVAAASIAQVHRAKIETPLRRHAVAVKVLRPGIERRLKTDL